MQQILIICLHNEHNNVKDCITVNIYWKQLWNTTREKNVSSWAFAYKATLVYIIAIFLLSNFKKWFIWHKQMQLFESYNKEQTNGNGLV